MPRFTSLPRPVLLALAVLLGAAMLLHSALWMYYIRWQPSVYLGTHPGQLPRAGELVIAGVTPKSPAAQAGLETGDRILSINGRPMNTLFPYYDVLRHGHAEDPVRVIVERPGDRGPHVFQVELHPSPVVTSKLTWLEFLSRQLITSFPLWFLIVSLPVLFMRLRDRNAWLMTLLFAGTIGGGPVLFLEPLMEPHLDHFAAAFKIIFAGTLGPLFNYFFSVFPVRSFLDRRLPWLKTVLLAAALLVAVPLAGWAFFSSSSQPLWRLAVAFAPHLNIVGLVFADFLLPIALGTISLIGHGFFSESREVQRKTRVIVWGTLAGLLPGLLTYSVPAFLGAGTQSFPFWLWGLISLASFWLFPLSFAYAVVKHRALEIPLLLRRSARYVLVKQGFLLLTMLVTVGAMWLFFTAFTRLFRVPRELALPVGMGVGITVGMIFTRINLYIRRRVTQKVDRAFFRSAYDVQQVLESLAPKSRKATDREQLASLLQSEITQALHPTSVAVYLEARDGRLRLQREGLKPDLTPLLSPNVPLLEELARGGEPFEVLPPQSADGAKDSVFGSLQPECLVPLLRGDGHLSGVVALGSRLSEEPYSRDDKRLLASVASQAGLALESIRLGEDIAERIEGERRAARDLEIAKQVQARLLPQTLPAIESLDYTGGCIQARQVGGDYYDFLDLGPGRLGIVLADIAGKGISGALLMANLQANLRSQSAVVAQDLSRFLTSVNRLFYANTSDESYATLFFADYEEEGRHLRYANCGHNPPFLLRADGTLERLESTTTIVGAFSKWDCPIREISLQAGDVLLIYTDGITEATNEAGEEFGDQRLASLLRELRGRSAEAILESVFAAVQQYTTGEQSDDLTLVVIRGL